MMKTLKLVLALACALSAPAFAADRPTPAETKAIAGDLLPDLTTKEIAWDELYERIQAGKVTKKKDIQASIARLEKMRADLHQQGYDVFMRLYFARFFVEVGIIEEDEQFTDETEEKTKAFTKAFTEATDKRIDESLAILKGSLKK